MRRQSRPVGIDHQVYYPSRKNADVGLFVGMVFQFHAHEIYPILQVIMD